MTGAGVEGAGDGAGLTALGVAPGFTLGLELTLLALGTPGIIGWTTTSSGVTALVAVTLVAGLGLAPILASGAS